MWYYVLAYGEHVVLCTCMTYVTQLNYCLYTIIVSLFDNLYCDHVLITRLLHIHVIVLWHQFMFCVLL